MNVFADDQREAEKSFILQREWLIEDQSGIDRNILPLIQELYGKRPVYRSECHAPERWSNAFYVHNAPFSHFDLMEELNKQNSTLPDGILCVAGTGHRFHGQRGRRWEAQEGNLHLVIHLAPGRKINHYHAGLPVLSAVSIVQAIDAIEGLEGEAEIKWVNDVMLKGAKTAGFLVHTQSVHDQLMSIILGIGLNIEKTPTVAPDVFTPKVGSLRDFIPSGGSISQKKIMKRLLESLDKNLEFLYGGQYGALLDFYRERSAVIGRKVRIFSDTPGERQALVTSGIVEKIGDDLELWIEGQKKPVKEGRLVFQG